MIEANELSWATIMGLSFMIDMLIVPVLLQEMPQLLMWAESYKHKGLG